MTSQKTNKQTLLWIGIVCVSAVVAVVTAAVLLRRYFKSHEPLCESEPISFDFEPEELAFDDEFGAENVIDVTEVIEQA